MFYNMAVVISWDINFELTAIEVTRYVDKPLPIFWNKSIGENAYNFW